MTGKQYFIGVDVGQIQDHTAIAVVEAIPPEKKQIIPEGNLTVGGAPVGVRIQGPPQEAEVRELYPRIQCHKIQSLRLGIRFQDIARRLSEIEGKLKAKGEATVSILVDATGPGQPVPELIREQVKSRVISCRFTSGTEPHREGDNLKLPKDALVMCLKIFLQNKRLELPGKTKDPDQARAIQEMLLELQNFQSNQPKEGARAETFEAKVGSHDDLVTALGLAAWGAKNCQPCRPFIRRL